MAFKLNFYSPNLSQHEIIYQWGIQKLNSENKSYAKKFKKFVTKILK